MNHKIANMLNSVREYNRVLDGIKTTLRNAGYDYNQITPLSFLLISVLHQHKNMSVTDLAEHCNMASGSVDRMLVRIVDNGFLRTYLGPSSGARPPRYHELTPKGFALIKAFNLAQLDAYLGIDSTKERDHRSLGCED